MSYVSTVLAGMTPVSSIKGDYSNAQQAAVGLSTGPSTQPVYSVQQTGDGVTVTPAPSSGAVDSGEELGNLLNTLVKQQVAKSAAAVSAPTLAAAPTVTNTTTTAGGNGKLIALGTALCILAAGITIYQQVKKGRANAS